MGGGVHGRDRGGVVWPVLSLPAGRYSAGYFTLWAVIAIAWGTVGSAVIIFLPLVESWDTICKVYQGMFTCDAVYERLDGMNLRLKAIMADMPEAEERYQVMQEKGLGAVEMVHSASGIAKPSVVANDDGDDLSRA